MKNFYSIYSHNFIRVSACILPLKVADPVFNVEQTLELARRASEAKASIALFPELGISSYTADDLFHQQALLDAVINGVEHIVEASHELMTAIRYPKSCVMLRFRAGKLLSKPYAIAATAANVKSMELRSFCPEKDSRKIPDTRKTRSENSAGGVPRLNPLSAT